MNIANLLTNAKKVVPEQSAAFFKILFAVGTG